MAEPFLSEIRIMAFDYAPRGWAQCNGQILAINQNQALFSLLGTMYGGDGRTTFALPDLRGRVPVHVGPGFVQGQRGGEAAHTLTNHEIPAHTHALVARSEVATEIVPSAGATLATSRGQPAYSTSTSALVPMALGAITTTGSSQPHENRQPYRVLTFCIALQGIYPSRS
ncbi:phage tail protein [Sandaracinus amylolyticus]|uniref:Microcystin dependent protein n=1 Tax=Sandaracinus amylolyticus TaxID=927083 RepID=A0A0F6YK58_9BACT|nr:tail fiber protein [Sandaracinus amylolyticus]AKF07713.1 Microcystin dependent protein [Sandaracinus amylolyticus]